MSVSPRAFHGIFQGRLQKLDGIGRRLEVLHNALRISRSDLERIYAGLFIDAVTTFEGFLESLFVGILTGRVNFPKSRVNPRIRLKTSTDAMAIICGERKYVDWLPFHETARRAEAYLTGGRPFSLLSQADQDKLAVILHIRNAIAHSSDYALKVFQKNIASKHVLLPRERYPAAFLRTWIGAPGGATRFSNYLSDLVQVGHALCG